MRLNTLTMIVGWSLCLIRSSFAIPTHDFNLEEALEEALELHHNSRGEAWVKATDPLERFDNLFSTYFLKQLVERGQFDLLFQAADEAFEMEIDRAKGMGSPPMPPLGLPYPPRPIHKGERGGLDGTSCRSCHFSGGPDGSGSGTSLAMFRGDGERIDSSTLRDPPALLGVGYIVILAKQMTDDLRTQREKALAVAKRVHAPFRIELSVQGVRFGWLTVHPNGRLDTTELKGISEDLVVRPLGWKGRHHNLVELTDEALALHHGLQTDHRAQTYEAQSDVYLGSGPSWDKDQDQVIQELTGAHSAALAAYITLISAPIYTPPTKSSDSWAWAKGRAWFEQIGCASCHRPSLRVKKEALHLEAGGQFPVNIDINPFEHGQEPRVRRVDYSSNATGQIPQGVPLFLFSDLKRHDMGEALADRVDEHVSNGQVVHKRLWLTRPLWGIASTAPYLHDGRAQTIEEAILAHGGEAMRAVELYQSLADDERGQLRMFLMTLGREEVVLVE
jgi:hypothetical protein